MKIMWISAMLLGLTLNVQANESVNQTLDVNPRSYIRIEHVNGEAQIVSWDKDQVKVTGTLGDKTDKFIFEREGNDVIIKVKVKKNKGWGNWSSDDGDDLKIWVPLNSSINYSAVNADVEVSDIGGGSEIGTVNGSIQVKNLGNKVKLESVNGNIDARELQGNVKIETVNGDIKSQSSLGREDNYSSVNGSITVNSDSEELHVETVNGQVELVLGKVRQLNLESVNGRIDASMTLQNNGEVNASTVGGAIDLVFQKDVAARFDIQTHAGGGIRNNLSDDQVQKNKYGPSRWLQFSLNGGKASVNVSTVSGSVTLDKK
jgi:DUF4097 and DUF4098 domain-containing protein YvlB